MKHGPHLNAEQKFLRTIWLTIFSAAKPAEAGISWFLTGTAAMTGLLITHIESITKIISTTSFKYGVACLVVSMVAGVVARAIGIGVSTRIEMLNDLATYLNSPEAQKEMEGMFDSVTPEDLNKKLAEPFLWPLNAAMLKGAANGKDFLSAEKACARSFSWMVRWSFIQYCAALIGLLVFLCGL